MTRRKPMPDWFWGEEFNDDAWHGPFASRSVAIADANTKLSVGAKFSIARLVPYVPRIEAGWLLDHLAEEAAEFHGDDLWPDVDDEQQADLEKQLNDVLARWLKKIDQIPEFGDFDEIEQHVTAALYR